MMHLMITFPSQWTYYWMLLQVLAKSTALIDGNFANLLKRPNIEEAKLFPEEVAPHLKYEEHNSQMHQMNGLVNSGLKNPGKTLCRIEEDSEFIGASSNREDGNRNGLEFKKAVSLDLSGGAPEHLPYLDTTSIVKQFQEAKFSALLLDYDGTLVEIGTDPDKAVPSEALKDALGALDRKYPSIQVSIISGRMKDFLEQHLGHYENILLSAEHGAFVRKPGTKKWEVRVAPVDKELAIVRSVMEESTQEIPGSFIESKETSLIWNYGHAEDEAAAETETEKLIKRLEESEASATLHIQRGHKGIEMKVQSSKGEIAVECCKAQSQATAILVLGDDFGDEPMFEAVAEYAQLKGPEACRAITTAIVNNIKKRSTKAQAHIPTVKASVNLVRAIAGLPTI